MVQSTIGVLGPIKQTVQTVKEQSVDVANTAITRIGSAAWWLFLLSLLTLGASLGGGSFGLVEDPMLTTEGQPMRDVRRTG